MPNLPIQRMILYKHGVGYFERRGPYEGTTLQLQFAREAMDDVLKSLVVLDLGEGQVLGIDFETPEDRQSLIDRGSIHLSDQRSLLDLLRDLRGRMVRLSLQSEQAGAPQPHYDDDDVEFSPDALSYQSIEGLVVGIDIDNEQVLRRPIVTIYQSDIRQLRTFEINEIQGITLLDEQAASDLSYFLRASQSEEDRRSATVHLSSGKHSLLVGYIAPAPSWRVSYRMLVEPLPINGRAMPNHAYHVLLQGWGLFDNQLEEDLEGVELTLMAGMPVSFRYRLYEPHTPERPLVEDEERTVNQPVFFDATPKMAMRAMPAPAAPMMESAGQDMFAASAPPTLSMERLEETLHVSASGEERGALFAYHVAHPVNVARGQSAMVPILSKRIPCERNLMYNGRKLPKHPVASLRLINSTGLTLERGPVTVLELGDYAGEAVLPFTRVDSELIVPYAVELGVTVLEKTKHERRLAGVSLRNQYLLFQEFEIITRSYEITSTLAESATVTIEHERFPHYDLWKVRQPDEETATHARWHIDLEPHARTLFEVHERQLQRREEHVRGLTGERLRELVRDRYLDEETSALLEEILAIYRRVDEAQQRINAIEHERKQIYAHQKQIQASLAPLGKEGDEGALRQRYVATLSQSEDQLSALAQEETRLKALITTLEREAQRLSAQRAPERPNEPR